VVVPGLKGLRTPHIVVPFLDGGESRPAAHCHEGVNYAMMRRLVQNVSLRKAIFFFFALTLTTACSSLMFDHTCVTKRARLRFETFFARRDVEDMQRFISGPNHGCFQDIFSSIPAPIVRVTGHMARRHRVQPAHCETPYCIKGGYVENIDSLHFDDVKNKDEWQDEVYMYAYNLASVGRLHTIVDVGCGSGFKLLKYFGQSTFRTIGYEVEPALSHLRDTYPTFTWLDPGTSTPSTIRADVVISSDVIEHVKSPDEYMSFLLAFGARVYIISTPERDNARGKYSIGPPENRHHVREWSRSEFVNYISKFLHVAESWTADTFNKPNASQWVVATTKSA
jgi:hypothetical protein